ncbi:hypothetical protein, partial [Endozoicomonas sp. SESOKO1]|uniref:hypothetical protein n=1 Tax=Endozoicomonas sp. SESOKO1 TaxID=2828742 RepID=UPI002149813E
MSRQIDQEIIQATDELKNDVALTTEIITGNENTMVEVAPGNTVRSPKKMIEDCYQETQEAIEQKFGSLDQAVNDATAAADRADSAKQSASDSAGDSAEHASDALASATLTEKKLQQINELIASFDPLAKLGPQPVSICISYLGTFLQPVMLTKLQIAESTIFAANVVHSSAYCQIPAARDFTVHCYRNDQDIGQVLFLAGADHGDFHWPANVVLQPGDVFSVHS